MGVQTWHFKRPTYKMISQAPQYAFLCHKVRIAHDTGIMHMIVSYIVTVQRSF